MTLIQTVQLGPRMGRLFGWIVGPSNNEISQGVVRSTNIKILTWPNIFRQRTLELVEVKGK